MIPMLAPRMTSPAINWFILWLVHATMPPTTQRSCPKRITPRLPKISESRPATENVTAAAAPHPDGIQKLMSLPPTLWDICTKMWVTKMKPNTMGAEKLVPKKRADKMTGSVSFRACSGSSSSAAL